MPVITITREMGTLGKDVAAGLSDALEVPVIYNEIVDHLADRLRVRKSHVIRLLDGRAGLLERLAADKTSLFVHSAEEVMAMALQPGGAIIRGWGASHLLRAVPHAVCVRVCSPLELRVRRMMERLSTENEAEIRTEIQHNDEAHAAIVRRHFGVEWTDPAHYDLVLNTERVSIGRCVEQVLALVRAPEFAETDASRGHLEDLAVAARVRAALLRAAQTRDKRVQVTSERGRVILWGAKCSTDEKLNFVEIASAVQGVRDVAYRSRLPEEAPPRAR
ncbi:MAG: cytidylate kinase-like family protein [Betaproteobacteria bacterium]|nr:MAG: cytidylate kinase-like family protein [Betaproteobacteria bacterium]